MIRKIIMKKIFLFAFLFLTFNLVPPTQAKDQDFPTLPAFGEKEKSSDKKNYIEGEVIVKYKDKTDKKSFEKKLRTKEKFSQFEIAQEIEIQDIALIKSKDRQTADIIAELRDNPEIEIIEPNYKREKLLLPNDPYLSQQWSLDNTRQTINRITGTFDADIDIDEMWDIESFASRETIVAVIDDGIDYNHPDLVDNMWNGSSCVDDSGQSISGGCPYHGWDYQNRDNNPYNDDYTEDFHGTMVSSVITSRTNNGTAMAGLSYHNKIKLMGVKFDFDLFSEIDAIQFAHQNGAKVINASYSGADYSALEKQAIENFGGIFVAAAGNASENNDAYPQYPCNYNSANIICVASSDQNDNLSDFSNYGPTTVDIMAPGENILSVFQGKFKDGSSSRDNYGFVSGTSLAAPMVSGITALLYAHQPTASISTIRETLLKSSDHFSENATIACGRRLNARISLTSAVFSEIPAETCTNTNASLFFDQSTITKTLGQDFNITARINPGTNNVGAVELDITFDPTVLQLNNITKSDSFNITLSSPTINNITGRGSIDLGLLTNPPSYINTVSNIATFNFTTLKVATNSPISFAESSNASANGEYVVLNRENTNIIITLTTPLYRFFNKIKGNHFYTKSIIERDNIINNLSHEWTYENIAYQVFEEPITGILPIYRFWNKKTGFHFYTQNEDEKNNIIATLSDTWNYEDVAYYTYSSEQPGTTAVYRFFNKIQGNHFYTTSVTERNDIINNLFNTWNYENVAWYVPE